MLPFTTRDHKLDKHKRWRVVEALRDMFWRRYTNKYVPSLNVSRKWNQERRNFQVTDLVLLKHDIQYRYLWSLARVIHANKGKY